MIKNTHCTTPDSIPFQQIQLRGGPSDGQLMNIPADQDQVELTTGGTRHTYRRVNSKAQLWHDRDALLRIGGGR